MNISRGNLCNTCSLLKFRKKERIDDISSSWTKCRVRNTRLTSYSVCIGVPLTSWYWPTTGHRWKLFEHFVDAFYENISVKISYITSRLLYETNKSCIRSIDIHKNSRCNLSFFVRYRNKILYAYILIMYILLSYNNCVANKVRLVPI